VCDSSSLDGAYCVSHRWTWDPGITFGWIHLLHLDGSISGLKHKQQAGPIFQRRIFQEQFRSVAHGSSKVQNCAKYSAREKV
jgi:hypothetical protein